MKMAIIMMRIMTTILKGKFRGETMGKIEVVSLELA